MFALHFPNHYSKIFRIVSSLTAYLLLFVLSLWSLGHSQAGAEEERDANIQQSSSPTSAVRQQVELSQFTPLGVATEVRQVRAAFSTDVVPFADPRMNTDIFSVHCSGDTKAPQGTARWADSQNWVYDFSSDLKAGVQCEFHLDPNFITPSGSPIKLSPSLPTALAFSTGGPIVTRVFPWAGDTISEDQAFILKLNGDFDLRSVLKEVFLSSESVENRISIKLIEGEEKDALLKSEVFDLEEIKSNTFAIVQPKQKLAPGSKVNLVWGKNVATPDGVTSEIDQVFSFYVRTGFELSVICERTHAGAGCNPLRPVRLGFSSPAEASKVQQIRLKTSAGATLIPDTSDDSKEPYVHSLSFAGPFEPKTTLTVELPSGIEDDSGRDLEPTTEALLTVDFDDYPPLIKFAAPFALVEWDAQGSTPKAAIPVTVRDVEPELLTRLLDQNGIARYMRSGVQSIPLRMARVQAIPEMQRLLQRSRWESHYESIFLEEDSEQEAKLPSPELDISEQRIPRPHAGKAFEVMGIPVNKPGFYVIEVESPKLADAYRPKGNRFFVRSSALVTNLAVHFRWGKERSLAWVTAINSGTPVPGAQLSATDCNGEVLWQGVSDKQGLAFPTNLPAPTEYDSECRNTSGVYLSATLGEDFSFTSSTWDDGIEPWRFGVPVDYSTSSEVAHTVFSENLIRRGKTVYMKHYLRLRGGAGLQALPASRRPALAIIKHQGSDETVEMPLRWNSNGTSETSWIVPTGAKLGTYAVSLRLSEKPNIEWRSGSFRVDDFKVPLMVARVKSPSGIQVTPTALPFEFSLGYLAGGSASNLPILARYSYDRLFVSMGEDFQGYSFLTGAVKEGIFRSDQEEDEFSTPQSYESAELPKGVTRKELTLDSNGTGSLLVPPLASHGTPYQATTELEYRDPNGEIQTNRASASVWPSDIALGIKSLGWTGNPGRIAIEVIALSKDGAPLKGSAVSVSLFQSKTFTHRKRLVGGFYAYESSTETKRIGALCSGNTNERGVLSCDEAAPGAGEFLIEARTEDSQGRGAVTSTSAWVTKNEPLWFQQEQGDRVDLLAEKRLYEIGDEAHIQIRSPFEKATALISVEREGIIESFVKEIDSRDPIIRLPIKANYAPNVFVSALLTRGRIGDVQPTALLDLGKPAVRLGVVELKVSRIPHQLHVKVTTDQDTYGVRETAKAKIIVQASDQSRLERDAEIVIAVVDEALLELEANNSWDILEGMLGRRAHGVRTSTALLQLVGKRHFGLKALPVGGGGGKSNTRELFDTLLLWKGAVKLSPAGVASISIPLNDSLSRFRVVAIASSGQGKFGTGHSSFTTSQDLMVLPGVLPLAREGDLTTVEATLRNTTENALSVKAVINAERTSRGSGLAMPLVLENTSRLVTLQSDSSERITWDVVIPGDTSSIDYGISITGSAHGLDATQVSAEGISDAVKLTQKIAGSVRPTLVQASMQQVDTPIRIAIEPPKDAVKGYGGIRVTFSRSLLNGSTGVQEHMRSYPYTCLEQKVSRAVALGSQEEWNTIVSNLPSLIDSQGFLKYFPSAIDGSVDLTSYLVSIAHAAGFELPPVVREQVLLALQKVASGKKELEVASGSGHVTQQRIAALEALARHTRADPVIVNTLPVDLRTLPTFSLVQWWSVLSRAADVTDKVQRLEAVVQALHARLNYQGTMLMLSQSSGDDAWWFMSSVDRALNQLILTALESDTWTSDIPKLVRGSIERQREGAWDLTTANAWGALMLRRYSEKFEKSPVSGVTEARLTSADATAQAPFYKFDWSSAQTDKRQIGVPAPFGLAPFPLGPSVLELAHRSSSTAANGAPWAFIQSIAAIPLKKALSSGYSITKTVRAIERAHPDTWSVGDIVQVRLSIDAQADRTWVVVDDPIPAGTRIMGMNNRSNALVKPNDDDQDSDEDSETTSWTWPLFIESSFESYRAYFDYVPKGTFTLEYLVRLNSPGTFNLPATRVEAMYSPEMFGELPNPPMNILAASK